MSWALQNSSSVLQWEYLPGPQTDLMQYPADLDYSPTQIFKLLISVSTRISDLARFCLELYALSEQRQLKSMTSLKLINPESPAPLPGTVKALAWMLAVTSHSTDAERRKSANNLLKTFKDCLLWRYRLKLCLSSHINLHSVQPENHRKVAGK